eukprot:3941046-Rhodomonas_salina.2
MAAAPRPSVHTRGPISVAHNAQPYACLSTTLAHTCPCLDPSPSTRHPRPVTIHPYTFEDRQRIPRLYQSQSLPLTLHPPPFTLHPPPSTLHPPPVTFHPYNS